MTAIHKVEIVVHVDETLDEAQRAELIAYLEGCEGVEKAKFTPGREHLMMIDYDSDSLHARDVLEYVQKHHNHAELIGPI